jgi:uncharacterized protein Veg
MIIDGYSLDKARVFMNGLQGKPIYIKVNRGRRKCLLSKARVIGTYASIFTVEIPAGDGSMVKASFSYTDLLTGSIQLRLPEDNSGNQLT